MLAASAATGPAVTTGILLPPDYFTHRTTNNRSLVEVWVSQFNYRSRRPKRGLSSNDCVR